MKNGLAEKIGGKIGYIFSIFFATGVFFILAFSRGAMSPWLYLRLMLIIFLISLTGIILERFLKC